MDKFLTNTNPISTSKRPNELSPEQWRNPRKIAATSTNSVKSKEIPTENSFKSLPVDTNEVTLDPFQHACKRKADNNIPLIIIEMTGDWTHQKVRNVIEKYTKDYHLQHRGRKLVRVQCYSAKIHQQLREALFGAGVSCHTFTRKDEKVPKVVLKGLPKYAHESIGAELETLGFTGANISELKTHYPSECPPLLIQLPNGTDMARFKRIKYLSNCVVDIQRYKPAKSTGTQCFRCQGFGHSARNCNRNPRCVKCDEPHPTRECSKKDRVEPACCCNCKQDHPANYAQCPERLKYIKRIDTRRETLRKTMTFVNVNTKMPTPNAWAQTQKSGPLIKQKLDAPPNVPITSNVNRLDQYPALPQATNTPTMYSGSTTGKPLFDPETTEMLEILSTIQSIKKEFTKCNTFMEKVILILTHLGHYA